MRRYLLLASNHSLLVLSAALLIFSVILLWAMAHDPKEFSIHTWQPLMAAIIAFIGGIFAYQAAMAKVDLDRKTRLEEDERRKRGILLRLRLAAEFMTADARRIARKTKVPKMADTLVTIGPRVLRLRANEMFDEAWANLDVFPASIARIISDFKHDLVQFADAKEGLDEAETLELKAGVSPPPGIKKIRAATASMAILAREIYIAVDKELDDLPEQEKALQRQIAEEALNMWRGAGTQGRGAG